MVRRYERMLKTSHLSKLSKVHFLNEFETLSCNLSIRQCEFFERLIENFLERFETF